MGKGKKVRSRHIDRLLIVGTSISILIALILYFSGVDTLQSLIVGILGIVLTIQIDFIGRLEHLAIKNTSDTRLLQQIGTSGVFRDLLVEVVGYCARIASGNLRLELFAKRAVIETERYRDIMMRLSRGELRTGPYDNDAIVYLINMAKDRLDVVSLSSANDEWWDTPMGEKTWKANVDAIARGITITRVFIFDEYTKAREATMQKHEASGVKVHWSLIDDLPVELRVGFAVFDDWVCYQIVQTADGRVAEYVFTYDEADVRKLKHCFERVLFVSHQFATKQNQIVDPRTQ